MVARRELTNVAIESERFVGVNSGGMDQSASVFSKPGHLLHVSFVPLLSATPLPLPSTTPLVSFVIANTLITSDKHVTAKSCYNLRVVETLLGARLLSKHLGIPLPDGRNQTYKSLTDTYFLSRPSEMADATAKNAFELKTMLALAEEALAGPGREEGETWEEVFGRLGESEEVVMKAVVGESDVEPPNGKLKIWTRARHVVRPFPSFSFRTS